MNNYLSENPDNQEDTSSTDKFSSLADIFRTRQKVKAPAYPWQDLALQVIKELNIPDFKRGAIFKVCRDYPKHIIMLALNDTKELCKSGATWKYFFKLIDKDSAPDKNNAPKKNNVPDKNKSFNPKATSENT